MIALGEIRAPAQQIRAAANLIERRCAQCREAAPDVGGDEVKERLRFFGRALVLRAQRQVLGGDADRTRVLVTLARVDATQRDEQRRAEAAHVGAEHRCEHDVAAGLETAVDAQFHARAQPVGDERVVHFDETEFPRQTGRFDRTQRRCAGTAVVAADVDHVGVGLRDAAGDVPDAGLADEFHRDARLRRGPA